MRHTVPAHDGLRMLEHWDNSHTHTHQPAIKIDKHLLLLLTLGNTTGVKFVFNFHKEHLKRIKDDSPTQKIHCIGKANVAENCAKQNYRNVRNSERVAIRFFFFFFFVFNGCK